MEKLSHLFYKEVFQNVRYLMLLLLIICCNQVSTILYLTCNQVSTILYLTCF